MAVDKLVDSTQLDTDLTSVANAIRTKGGTSAQLAFPADFVSAVNAIPTGGSGVSSVFRLEDYKFASAKWILQNGVPNVLKTGGCIHIKATHTSHSTDDQLIGFGYGALSIWTPANYVACYVLDYNTAETDSMRIRFRGQRIDGTIKLSAYYDSNNVVDVKLYSDKLVDVNTGTEYALSTFDTGVTSAMTSLLTQNYLSVGQNYQAPVSGTILPIFALEES